MEELKRERDVSTHIRRRVIVIHGIGRHDRGDRLVEVVNPIVQVLQERGCKLRVLANVNYRANLKDQRPSEVVLILEDLVDARRNRQTQEWVFRETYWDAAVPAASQQELLRWVWYQGRRMGAELLATLANPAYRWIARRPRESLRVNVLATTHRQGYGYMAGLLARERTSTQDPEESIPVNILIEVWWWMQTVAMGIALVMWTVLSLFLVLGAWLLYSLPISALLPGRYNLARLLDRALQGVGVGIGDLLQYVSNEIWASNVRGELEETLLSMLKDPGWDSVTIISHSLGCGIAYDALSVNGSIGDRLGNRCTKDIILVTVGQAIGRLRDMAQRTPQNPAAATKFTWEIHPNLKSSLFWLNISTASDPTAAKPFTDVFFRQAKLDPTRENGRVKQLRVINLEDPYRDHSAYWRNKEMVVPRLIWAINGGQHLRNVSGTILSEVRAREVKRRYSRVGWLSFLRILAGALILVNIILASLWDTWRNKPWEWLLNLDGADGRGPIHELQALLMNNITRLDMLEPAKVLLVAAAGFLVVIGIYRAIRWWLWPELN